MELVQSFLFSITRVKLSLYEQRILVKVVEFAQKEIKGLPISRNLRPMNTLPDNVKIEIPVRDLLSEGSQHYHQVYEAAEALMSRQFEHYDPKSETWYAATIINNIQLRRRSGLLVFYVSKILFDVILDFTMGFRVLDLQTALSLPSPAAARLYVMMHKQEKVLELSVVNLKQMFGVADKYKQTADFIKKVIVPAKKALDDAGVDSFDFKAVKEGNKVVRLAFFPKLAQKSYSQMKADGEMNPSVYQQIRLLLAQYCGFCDKELHNNRKLLMRFSACTEALQTCYSICKRSQRSDNPKAYVIGSIKNELHIISAK